MSLRLVRRPRSPNWIIRGTLRRIRIEESTGTDNKKFAEEIRAKRESKLLRPISLWSSRYRYICRSRVELSGKRRQQAVS